MTDTVAGIAVLLFAVAAFNNYQRGTLGPWLRAKFLNSAAPAGAGQALVGRPQPSGLPAGMTAADASSYINAAGHVKIANPKPGDLTTVNGMIVAKSAAPSLEAMVAAARQSGVELTGGGYRPTTEQIRLREQHGCGGAKIYDPKCEGDPPTAVPGTSNHEAGLAVDFRNCSSRNTAVFRWLAANAATYGWKNFPEEPWHWSTGPRAGS